MPGFTSALGRVIAVLGVQTSDYRPRNFATDLTLGLINGVDNVLWSCAFASMLFIGGLAGHLPLGIVVILVSGAIISSAIAVTSKYPVHIAGVEEQAVAILATVAIAMNGRMSQFAGPDAAAATMFALMALSALLLGGCFLLAARFNLGLLIQQMPFPVVCGFLAGTGWLFFAAAIQMMTEVEVEVRDLAHIFAREHFILWMPGFLCGAAIYALMRYKDHFFALPAALLACLGAFYLISKLQGMTLEELREQGWVFQVQLAGGSVGLGSLDFGHLNVRFILSVLPEVGTIVMLSLLSALFSFSALELGSGELVDLRHELRSHGTANILSAAALGLPGLSDVASSVIYRRMGASSRLTPLICGFICLIAAFIGGGFITYLPKLLLGALVFLMAIHFLNDWLIDACRRMNWLDALTVWLIFGVIVVVDFLPGIGLGIIWTSMVFIYRFSKIEVVGSTLSLGQLSSSVERSGADRGLLLLHDKNVKIFNLSGFIFFGTANGFFERIRSVYGERNESLFAVFNFTRVIGIDSTGAQVFVKIITFMNSKGIKPVFCGMNPRVAECFATAQVFEEGDSLVFDNLDLALEAVEERLLLRHPRETGHEDIRGILRPFLGDADKVDRLVGIMDRLSLKKGDFLFRQGACETSFYLIESGTIEVRLEEPGGRSIRLREFREGSILGEMAAVTEQHRRSASAVATDDAVVYRLEPDKIAGLGDQAAEYRMLLHELIARLLASRLTYMNQRTQADI